MSAVGLLKGESAMCSVGWHCFVWARRYMDSCLCSTSEVLSVSLGMISVVSWCVAEIPQIITNYKKKSAEGLSLLFLLTWIIGDSFNLIGCKLEPETLPTQYYTAVLYAVTTFALTLQAIYYVHIYPRLKSNKRRQEAVQAETVERRECHDPDTDQGSYAQKWGAAPSSTIPDASSYPGSNEDLYYMSARSLSVSRTPPAVSILGPRSPVLDIEQRWFQEPLIRSPKSGAPRVRTMLCVVSLMIFVVGIHNHERAERLENNAVSRNPKGGIVLQVGRQILQATESTAHENMASGQSAIGSILGWGMAVIYLGGRLPQIYLNTKRGHTEGLNALMFVFAVTGNTTYVASILINSLEWQKIKPNLPWLVDAGGCATLDAFILIQFVYFRYRKRNEDEKYVS